MKSIKEDHRLTRADTRADNESRQGDLKTDSASRLRILVCDDDPGIREVYRHALSKLGHAVVPAASGRSALQFMMQYRFDILSVDIQMPGMNGIVFLQEALKIWPWIGVVVVSGFADGAAVAELRAMGVERVLHKPVALEALIDNIVAAAAERSKPDEHLPGEPLLTLMKDHLKLLSQASEASIGTGALADILNDFVRDLAFILPCDMLAMLVVEEHPVFMAHLRRPVSSAFVEDVCQELLTRYHVVSGQDLQPATIETRIDGMQTDDDGPESAGTTFSVPVFLDDAVCAMLILATHEQTHYRPADVSLLYLAANHVGVFVLTLRRMQHLAMRDGLTGLFNRLRIEEELERAWLVADRYGTPMAIVVLDIDHFKVMNDTYGHATGDQVLCAFADLMRQAARATDVLARFGGDEFIAVLSHANVEETRMFCDRLRQITRDHTFCPSTHRLKLTVSMGLATSDNSSAPSSAAELLSQADRALYRAKRAGRDRICVWTGNGDTGAGKSLVETAATSMAAKGRAYVLLAGDDEGVQGLLADLLAREGYDVRVATSATGALAMVKAALGFYDIMVVDIDMPDMAGIELLKWVSEADHLLVTMTVAGQTKLEEVVQCLREGAIDLLLKPVEPELLLASMRRAMRYRSLKLENLHHQRHLERMVEQRSTQLRQMLEDVKRSYEFTLEAFTTMLDAREHQTGRHSLRVREMSIWLARRMNVRGNDLDEIAAGALLHDIGKVAVPDRVLLSADSLPPEERHIMQAHTETGKKILAGSDRLAGAARIVAQHHEWYDGSGYPDGLKKEEICLGARIFAVVDAYDAMRSDRAYRSALSEDEAVTEIIKKSGSQFDPVVVEAFLNNRDECAQLFQNLSEDHSAIPTVLTD